MPKFGDLIVYNSENDTADIIIGGISLSEIGIVVHCDAHVFTIFWLDVKSNGILYFSEFDRLQKQGVFELVPAGVS